MQHTPPISLFSPEPRTDSRPRNHGEPSYVFLDRAAGAPWQRIRETLDGWFGQLPPAAQEEVRTRFRERDNLTHMGAFWELWVHEAHRRLGWNVIVHVGTEPGERRQDFEVERDGVRFWIEATVVSGDSLVKATDQKRYAQLCDLINQVRAPKFFVGLTVLSHGSSTPGRKKVVAPIERWLGGLDPEEVRAQWASDRSGPTLCLEFDDWKIEVEAIAANNPQGDDHRVLGIQSLGADYMDDVTPLRRKIKNKAGRYGKLDRPHLLAVLSLGDVVHDIDIGNALFGTSALQIHPDSGEVREIRTPDGAWMGPKGPQNTRLSGVLIARGLVPHGVASILPILWRNPWAAHPLPQSLPWQTYGWEADGQPQVRPASVEAQDLFGLPEGWPEVENPRDAEPTTTTGSSDE